MRGQNVKWRGHYLMPYHIMGVGGGNTVQYHSVAHRYAQLLNAITTCSIAFTTRFIPFPESPFHCLYEQPYPHFTCGRHISLIQPVSVLQ